MERGRDKGRMYIECQFSLIATHHTGFDALNFSHLYFINPSLFF